METLFDWLITVQRQGIRRRTSSIDMSGSTILLPSRRVQLAALITSMNSFHERFPSEPKTSAIGAILPSMSQRQLSARRTVWRRMLHAMIHGHPLNMETEVAIRPVLRRQVVTIIPIKSPIRIKRFSIVSRCDNGKRFA
ncbi:hypothetical protein [Agrobacterium tumefaciens]|uniref:hypothetical protein n=1 Tax=Agrobacterium tumefaciens TaxID=358 RepID=UPI001FAA8FF4|nr:hypothetical protein [Agrobacterium tumefaciens]UNZ53868.1 hypothetical protein MLE07_24360 [Agrobacterium tumefaciens]